MTPHQPISVGQAGRIASCIQTFDRLVGASAAKSRTALEQCGFRNTAEARAAARRHAVTVVPEKYSRSDAPICKSAKVRSPSRS